MKKLWIWFLFVPVGVIMLQSLRAALAKKKTPKTASVRLDWSYFPLNLFIPVESDLLKGEL